MEAAYRRLLEVPGWTRISESGPELLPESTPARWRAAVHNDLFLGVDHTAIGISDTARSLAFYGRLGLRVSAQSLNVGSEQQLLDALVRPEASVTALSLRDGGPHPELLCYLNVTRAPATVLRNNDIAASRTVFEMTAERAASAGFETCLRDPDGHHVQIISNEAR